jgi:pimeloyl-ACP methyl ester carboxylesterase
VNVVLLHGWPLDERMWEPQVAALQEAGHDPVAPRLYGRGPSIDAWAAQLLSEVDGPFVAVGLSMGGYCALALARRASERVPGIVLVSSRAGADSEERRRIRDEQIATLRADGVPADFDTDVPAEDLAVAQEAMRDRPDASDTVGAFGGPLLVCVGDHDELVSVEEARAIADRALLGSLEIFAGAGHFLSIEQPDRFNAVLLEFLDTWRT